MRIFNTCFAACAVAALGLIDVILPGDGGSAQELAPPPGVAAGVEVDTRGPVHEAFAQPTVPRQDPAKIIPKQPPEPVNELPPEQRPEGDHVEWIPGYWAWDDDRSDFLWVSGVWRIPPPGYSWTPGYWLEADGGWRWVSGYWDAIEDTSVELYPEPPDPIPEAIPVAPNEQSVYTPGCWVYQQNRYWWRPGFWVGVRPGWLWMPAGYYWTPGGYAFVNSHWDLDLQRRGLAFAPAYINRSYYGRPGWFYRPNYAIAVDFLFGSLFVNLGRNHYYFGDYYDPFYVQRGFTPWVNYGVGARYYDPLFAYYRWQHRGDARWENNLRAVYSDRRVNKAARPPHTVAQQQKAGAKVQVVASLDHMPAGTLKLQPVSAAQVKTLQTHATQVRALSHQRGKIEVQARGHVKGAVGAAAAPVKIDLPRPKQAAKPPQGDHAPPPRPVHPKVQPKSAPKGKGGGAAVEPIPGKAGKPMPKGTAEPKGKPPIPETKHELKGKTPPPKSKKKKNDDKGDGFAAISAPTVPCGDRHTFCERKHYFVIAVGRPSQVELLRTTAKNYLETES